MHKSRLGTLVIDCQTDSLEQAAGFWAAALGRPEKKEARAIDPLYAQLQECEGELPVLVQKVGHDSRVHLDIETDDIEAEARRLEALGAKRLGAIKKWVVMEAPTGQRFCLVRPQRPGFEEKANRWD